MALPLEELDQLLPKCRNDRARQYLQEAIFCYRANAFRSAILAVWTAVTFDLFDKLKEIAVMGDNKAEKLIEELEKAASINDTYKYAKLDKDFIIIARDKFELLPFADSIDLERLQQDRNRCINPCQNLSDELFSPTGELVLVHINSAVSGLLQHPVYRGKNAIDSLIIDIDDRAFPANKELIIEELKKSILSVPRKSLLKEFINYLLRKCLTPELEVSQKMRYFQVINAVRELHGRLTDEVLQQEIPKFTAHIKGNQMEQVLSLVSYSTNLWPLLDSSSKSKISAYVRRLSCQNIKLIRWLLAYEPLKQDMEYRISNMTDDELTTLISTGFYSVNPVFVERIIDFYAQSASYEFSNEWVVKHYGYIGCFTPKHVEKIIHCAANNEYVSGSFNFEKLVTGMRNTRIIPLKKFDELLENNDLYGAITGKVQYK